MSEGASEGAAIELPRADEPQVTIAVIATRDAPRLARCLGAIARNAPASIPVEVVLVMNGPTDEIRELVTTRVRGARIAEPGVNAGTAAGWNTALLGARGRWFHVLHEDAEVQPGWLEPLVAALEAHPEAGQAGSRLMHPDGRLQNTGWIAWRDGWVTQISPDFLPGAELPATVTAVDHISSAAMLVDRADLLAGGGFEERLSPGTFVDAYLGMALWRRGRATLTVPDSVVLHTQGAMVSSDGDPFASEQFRMWMFLRNIERFRELAADVLAGMEPRAVETMTHEGFDAESLARVLARAEARRAAAGAARPEPAPPGPEAGSETWGPPDDVRRTLAERRRANELAFTAWLVGKEASARTSLEALIDERDVLRDAFEQAQSYARSLEQELARREQPPAPARRRVLRRR